MSSAELPLQELFEQLRLSELPLGVGEYLLMQRALQAGFGLADREALRSLCRLLWTRSPQEARLLDWHFDQLVPAALAPTPPAAPPVEKKSPQNSAADAAPTPAPSPTSSEPPARSPVESGAAPPMLIDPAAGSASFLLALPPGELQPTARARALARHSLLKFALRDEYLPITRRQMKQSWRYLREVVRQGPRTELDLDATLDRVAREGAASEPVLVPRRTNRAEIVFLIDSGGSMVPFHDLCRRLLDTAARGGRLGRMQVYYFHDAPDEWLFLDPQRNEEVPIESVLRRLTRERTAVLIVSDAGAARGHLDRQRIAETRLFLSDLQARAQRIAWMNPVPRSRWTGTSADPIRRAVPMFEFSRQGLDDAIDLLRGRMPRSVQP